MSTSDSSSFREQVLLAARTLFMQNGYEAVGMREIARAVGKLPVQLYRLQLSKSDILAELIIELNREQIGQLPILRKKIRGSTPLERTCAYLVELYRLDIEYLPIRSVGAAFGWTWSADQERRIIEQVFALIEPVVGELEAAGLDDIPARCMGIWSLYYVGFRHAVISGSTADECLAAIRPSLRYFLEPAHGR